jgi:hypothetical protein
MTAGMTSRLPRGCVGGGLRSAAESCMGRILVVSPVRSLGVVVADLV